MTERAYTRWTASDIARLRLMMRSHGDVKRAAQSLQRTAQECDLACWVMLGRTAEEAAPMVSWQSRAPEWSPFRGGAA